MNHDKTVDQFIRESSGRNSKAKRTPSEEDRLREQRDRASDLSQADAVAAKGYRMPRRRADSLTVRQRKECARINKKLSPRDRIRIRGTSLDNHQEMAALSLFDRKERNARIERAVAGEQVSAVWEYAKHKAQRSERRTELGSLVDLLSRADDDLLALALFDLAAEKRKSLQARLRSRAASAPTHIAGKQRRLDEADENLWKAKQHLADCYNERIDALCAFEDAAVSPANICQEALDVEDQLGTEWLATHGMDPFGFDEQGRPSRLQKEIDDIMTAPATPSMLDRGPASAEENLRLLMEPIKLGDGRQVLGLSHDTRGKAASTNSLWSLSDEDVKFFYRSAPGEYRIAA